MNNIERPNWDQTFIQILEVLAQRSKCLKIKTAALISYNHQILSIGYNGTFSKHIECCDYWFNIYKKDNPDEKTSFNDWLKLDEFRLEHRIWSEKNEIHAEANALTYIQKRNINDDYILYTLYSPCDSCTKNIISYGIKNVYYKYLYPRGVESLKLLKKVGINCKQITY